MDDAAIPGISPPSPAGDTLRGAREARGLSLDEVAARTRIPLRHLQAIERSVYTDLPSPTYAVGFAKAFARAVGADEVAVAARVRDEVARLGRRQPEYQPYVVADPARVPGRWLAIAGIGAAVAIAVLAALWFGTMRGGSPAGNPSPAPAPIASAPVPAAAAAPSGGQVTLAATDEVWLRVHDADGKRLYLGTMKPGERFDVPADANGPMIDVGRPDKLRVTLNGSAVPALGTGERPMENVRVDAAAIARRLAGGLADEPAGSSATPGPAASPGRARTGTGRPARRLTETQRANLESAAAARAGQQP